MNKRIVSFLLIVVVFAICAPAFAQKPAADAAPMPKYDAAKEVTIKGTIDEVKEMPMAKGEVGIHLMVKTAAETIEVRLCPSGYLKEFDAKFAKGEQIEVTGSKLKVDDKDVILAREVVQGNNTLILRDKAGAPVWTWLKKD